MKGKLQKSWVLSSIVLMGLTTTLPSVNMVLAETVNETQNTETQDVTLPYDNLLEAPTSESSDTQQEPTVEEQPTFSLEKEQMTGTLGETTEVVIFVDRPTNQVQVTIPQELTVLTEEIPEGMEATQMTETEWWFSADESTKFTIPVSSETAGEFTIRVEDELNGTIAFEEAADDESNDESIVTDDTDNTNEPEDSVTPEVQEEEEAPAQEKEEVTPATTSNVSTWAQFRTAINTASVTEINVLADISGNTSLNAITRNLAINGNGYTINSQSQAYLMSGSNRQLTVRNATIVSSLTNELAVFRNVVAARNVTYIFSDINYSGNTRFVDVVAEVNDTRGKVIFDGGISNLSSSSSSSSILLGIETVEITNNAEVHVSQSNFFNTLSTQSSSTVNRRSITISEGSTFSAVANSDPAVSLVRVQTLNIDGKFYATNSSGSNIVVPAAQATEPMRINMGSKSQVRWETKNNTSGILGIGDTALEMSVEKGAQFDIYNSGGGPIWNSTRSNTVQLTSENLAVWNRGRTSSTPSQNFENIEAQLTGVNAATITNTNHNVFRATFSKQGLAGYSRISSSGITGENPIDPLEPDTEIDPDSPPVIPENQGNFRLDFVSQFTFGSHERNMFEEETYYALPQYGLDSNGEVIENEPKPNFVQITDNRADADGWQLSVTQREQFKTETGNELSGASLQLKNRQLVADHDGQQPQEATTEETIILEPGAKQPLLTSSTGEGKGTWIYRFGDGTSSDQSVALVVPKESIPEATTYQTKLDWELQAVPSNE